MKKLLIKPVSCVIGSLLFVSATSFAAKEFKYKQMEDPMHDRGTNTSNGPNQAIQPNKSYVDPEQERLAREQAEQDRIAREKAAAPVGDTTYADRAGTPVSMPERSYGETHTTGTLGTNQYAKDDRHMTISFAAGSAMLSEVDKERLRELVRDARAKAPIDNVSIIAWSDKDVPERGEKLADVDRSLAKSRAEAISSFLKDEMGIARADIDTFNMAENANWFARTFRTQDWELKSIFSKKAQKAPVTNNEFQTVREEGGPSLAVVLMQKDKEYKK